MTVRVMCITEVYPSPQSQTLLYMYCTLYKLYISEAIPQLSSQSPEETTACTCYTMKH